MLYFRITFLASGLLALVAPGMAQTPLGFMPLVTTSMNVTFGTNVVDQAGELIPRADTANPPTISTTALNGTGIIFMIDLDVARNDTRVPLLHWFIPGVTVSGSKLNIPQPPPGASYAQPSPPVGDIPHRYTLLLFSQPANFVVPSQFASINPPASSADRVGFNITAFIAAAKLAAPVAANFIRVQNTTGTATTTFPSPWTSSPAGSTPTGSAAGTAIASATTGSAARSATGSAGATSTSPVQFTGEAATRAATALWKVAFVVATSAIGAALLLQ